MPTILESPSLLDNTILRACLLFIAYLILAFASPSGLAKLCTTSSDIWLTVNKQQNYCARAARDKVQNPAHRPLSVACAHAHGERAYHRQYIILYMNFCTHSSIIMVLLLLLLDGGINVLILFIGWRCHRLISWLHGGLDDSLHGLHPRPLRLLIFSIEGEPSIPPLGGV